MNILHESAGRLIIAEPKRKYWLYIVLCVLALVLSYSMLTTSKILDEPSALLVAGGSSAACVVVLLSASRNVCDFDREAGLLTITSHRYYGSRVRQIAWPTIAGIHAQVRVPSDNSGVEFYVVLTDGSEVRLGICDERVNFTNPEEVELRRALAELGLEIRG